MKRETLPDDAPPRWGECQAYQAAQYLVDRYREGYDLFQSWIISTPAPRFYFIHVPAAEEASGPAASDGVEKRVKALETQVAALAAQILGQAGRGSTPGPLPTAKAGG